jgi:hypothetical protein
MTRERMKIIKIVNELLSYFFMHHIIDVQIDIQYGEEHVTITIVGQISKKPDDVEELFEVLNAERQVEYEDYYWSLLGEHRNYSELNLLGSLVDKGEVTFEDDHLTVKVYRTRD